MLRITNQGFFMFTVVVTITNVGDFSLRAAGEKLNQMLEMGASQPWPDALEKLTGSRQIDAGALLEYFAPLKSWLDEENRGEKSGW